MVSLPHDIAFRQLARLGQALSNPLRWILLSLLSDNEKSVQEIVEQSGRPLANVSAQLKVLQEARLVTSRREGRRVLYRLAGDEVSALMTAMQSVGNGLLPEMRELASEHFLEPGIDTEYTPDELMREVRAKRVTLLDLRSPTDFASGHLAGAINLPADELPDRLSKLSPRARYVAYCRGDWCVTVINAVRRMREKGLEAHRLPLSVRDWRASGLPVETGAKTYSTSHNQGRAT